EGCPERKLAETMAASDRVHFLGIVPDILPVLYASDVYVMPSVCEGFGVAAVEAMGAGLPAILSDVTGLCDFREAGEGIYWVEPTPESITKGIRYFLHVSSSDRRRMGSKLSGYVHEHFSVEKGAGAYASLYRTTRLLHRPS